MLDTGFTKFKSSDLIYSFLWVIKEFSYTEPKINSSLIKETGKYSKKYSFYD